MVMTVNNARTAENLESAFVVFDEEGFSPSEHAADLFMSLALLAHCITFYLLSLSWSFTFYLFSILLHECNHILFAWKDLQKFESPDNFKQIQVCWSSLLSLFFQVHLFDLKVSLPKDCWALKPQTYLLSDISCLSHCFKLSDLLKKNSMVKVGKLQRKKCRFSVSDKVMPKIILK